MGNFIAISGIIAAEPEAVASELSRHVQGLGGIFEPATGSVKAESLMSIYSAHGNTTIVYPDYDATWQECSKALSQALETTVFSLHIHDDDLWMYLLFRNGIQVDAFNPIPDYWSDDISEQEWEENRGNAEIISQCVSGIAPEEIKKYLIVWDRDEIEESKAYPSDESLYGNVWQMVDFMKKLKLLFNSQGEFPEKNYRYKVPLSSRRNRT